jgi:hypothetical protein
MEAYQDLYTAGDFFLISLPTFSDFYSHFPFQLFQNLLTFSHFRLQFFSFVFFKNINLFSHNKASAFLLKISVFLLKHQRAPTPDETEEAICN